ncbi:MAG: tRNA (adenine-N1)-methyltransferase [Thermofilaceae archaeon]|nr:tRNA (adenine-N1)-methyltransferase [Thermofilaceae archaeon]
MEIFEGDFVILYLNEKRQYIVKIQKNMKYNFNEGTLYSNDIIGKKFGDYTVTNIGISLRLIKPSIYDIVYSKYQRVTQVIYPKDVGLIIFKLGIGPGSRVVEAGTGSGVLTTFLAHFVKPNGKVYTYEIRKDFLETARKNLSLLGLQDLVVLKEGDVRTGIEESDVDAVILDIAEPWKALPHAYAALRSGGILGCFLPTINQVELSVEEARRCGFAMIEAVETLLRKYKVKQGETRPEMRMVGHTGYIVFARKP